MSMNRVSMKPVRLSRLVAPAVALAMFPLALSVAPGVAPAAVPMAPVGMLSASSTRMLDFTPGDLRLWQDAETGVHYWFFTYEVVNNTGKDQRFAPLIELLSDEGVVVRQGVDVPSRIVTELKSFIADPLLEDQFEILGVVLQGKTNARNGLAVFRVPVLTALDRNSALRLDSKDNLDITELSVLVQGLSPETKKVTDPKSGEIVTLRRAVRLDYLVPGNPLAKGNVSYPVSRRDDSTFR